METETKLHEWESALDDYLLSAYGADGVSLSYVIHPNDSPYYTATIIAFNEIEVATVPLTSPAFDAQTLHLSTFGLIYTRTDVEGLDKAC